LKEKETQNAKRGGKGIKLRVKKRNQFHLIPGATVTYARGKNSFTKKVGENRAKRKGTDIKFVEGPHMKMVGNSEHRHGNGILKTKTHIWKGDTKRGGF